LKTVLLTCLPASPVWAFHQGRPCSA